LSTFLSIAKTPGATGSYYYNSFFQALNLDYKYEALQADTLEGVLNTLKAPQVKGISVTMPFKRQVVRFLDESDASVNETGSCNTVKVLNGKWVGYNTDLAGVRWVVSNLPPSGRIQILGDGAMSLLFQKVLNLEGREFTVYSRSLGNWENRHIGFEIVVNATALGTISPASPIELSDSVAYVVDLALNPGDLHSKCLSKGVPYISGLEFYKNVFLAQFFVYLDRPADPILFDEFTAARGKGS
jgi:shikimate 5-dehydrogenase